MIDSILDINVSCFENCKGTIPRKVSLSRWLTNDQYQNKVEELRSIQDDNLQEIIKKSLPAITPSGLFSYRAEKDLIEHSGFLAFDIDFKDNQHIINFTDLRDQISHIASVAYCGLSVRGKGFWGLVPMPKSTPDVHKNRFSALTKDFKEFGIILDPSGSDVCRLRIYSYDANAYFNHSAKIYTKLLRPQQHTYKRPRFSDNREKVEAMISKIKESKIDITQNYKEEWLKIASALSNEFGESGRGYFHTVSMFHPKYSVHKTDRMFDECLKHDYDKVTIASFFHIAESYSIRLRSDLVMAQSINKSIDNSFPKPNTDLTRYRENLQKPISPIPKTEVFSNKANQKKPTAKEEIWDQNIAELEKFFQIIKLPTGPIRLDKCSLITDVSLFIDSHLSIIKGQNGNVRYEPYLNRLQGLKFILSCN